MLLLHDSIDDAPFSEASELGLAQIEQEAVGLDVDEGVEVRLLHLKRAMPRLDHGEYLLASLLQVEVLEVDGKLTIFLVDLLHKLLRDAQSGSVGPRVLRHHQLVDLVGHVLADVHEVAGALVLSCITQRLLHDLLMFYARRFVVVVLPPGAIDTVVHVRIVVAVLCETIVYENRMKMVRPLLFFNVGLCNDLFEARYLLLQLGHLILRCSLVALEDLQGHTSLLRRHSETRLMQLIWQHELELLALVDANKVRVASGILWIETLLDDVLAGLEGTDNVCLILVRVQRSLQRAQRLLESLELLAVRLRALLVLVEEQVKVDG